MSESKEIEMLVSKAVKGDKSALEKILLSIKDKIYNLSVRMLWNPNDAEDVTQEILIKIITNLSSFRGESQLTTWAYKIAVNHLINTNKRGLEHLNLSFEEMEEGIKAGFLTSQPVEVQETDRGLLADELKVSCTHAMLLCLDREQRVIYILSTLFEVNSKEGGYILEISPETYRKRLSRIKEKMRNFMENNCGLANPDKSCRCQSRVEVAIESHRINPNQLLFANRPLAPHDLTHLCKENMEQLDRVAAVFTSNPYYLSPDTIINNIRKVIYSNNYTILQV